MKTSSCHPVIRVLALVVLAAVLLSIPCQAGQAKFRPMELPLNQPVQITAEADAVRGAAVSADGKWLVYVSGRDRFTDLWLRSADPARVVLPRRLTNDPSAEFSPAFSPDNRFIAYVGESHDVKGDIFLLEIDGTGAGPVRLTGRDTADGGPCFSPDGETLFFHQGAAGAAPRYLAALDMGRLNLKNADPGDDVVPPEILEIGGDGSFAAVSPDGGRIAFVSFRHDPAGDIFIFDRETGGARALTSGPAMDFSPAWSGDGGKILFSRVAVDTDRDGVLTDQDNPVIFAMDATDPGPGPFPLTPGVYSALQPRVSGERLYFLSDMAGVYNCWSLPAEGVTPAMERVEEQTALAEAVSGKIPFSPELAVAAWSKVLERFPDDPDAAARAGVEIGDLYLGMEREAAALSAFNKAASRHPDVRPWAPLAMIRREVIETRRRMNAVGPASQRLRSLERGLERIEEITEGQTPAVKARGALARAGLLAEMGNDPRLLSRGIALLDGVVAGRAGEGELAAEAMVLKGDLFSRIAGPDKVIPVYLSVVDEFPGSREWGDAAVERIIDIRVAETPLADPGADPGADRDARLAGRVEALRKIAGENMEKRPAMAIGALNRVGDLLFEAGELARAKNAYARVLERFKSAPDRTASARLSLAEILYREERFRQALDLYETEIASRSYEDDIYKLARIGFIRKSIASGEFLFRTGEIQAARSRFKSLMEYDDGVVEAHRGYIKCAAAMGDIPATLAVYGTRREENPGDPRALYNEALCLTWLDDKKALTEARTLLENAIRLDGGVEYFHQTLGYVLETLETVHGERGTLELALESYQKAWFLNDHVNNAANAANLALNLGNAHYLLGRYGRAFEFYSRRLETGKPFDDPNREILFYRRLGASAFQTGDSDGTIHAFTRALDLIDASVDPGRATRAFDGLHRFVMDRIVSPSLERPDLARRAERLAGAQSEINQRLGRLAADVRPPPDPQWTIFTEKMEALLQEEERLFPDLISLVEDLENAGTAQEAAKGAAPRMTPAEAGRSLEALAGRARRDLALPGRLVELRVEMLDRLGLALQEAGEWERA
ncbi:MAG: tetratricopeptide repeat protein, partial [Desulfobacterales bacterium]|nr:tetratricopeptide repeat protein [Desulfobacterales bacterium]